MVNFGELKLFIKAPVFFGETAKRREKKWRGALSIHRPCFNRPCPVCALLPAVGTAMIDQMMESEERGWGGRQGGPHTHTNYLHINNVNVQIHLIEAISTRGTLRAPAHQTGRYEPSQGGAHVTFTPPPGRRRVVWRVSAANCLKKGTESGGSVPESCTSDANSLQVRLHEPRERLLGGGGVTLLMVDSTAGLRLTVHHT